MVPQVITPLSSGSYQAKTDEEGENDVAPHVPFLNVLRKTMLRAKD